MTPSHSHGQDQDLPTVVWFDEGLVVAGRDRPEPWAGEQR